jgi:putative ABC transport system permease protein
MKLLLIAKNNMKKAKASTITLVLLVAIATIFLYVGTNVLSQIGTFIDDKNSKLNGAHEIVIASRDSNKEIQSIFEGIDDFFYMEQEDALMYGASEFQNIDTKEKKYAMPSIVLNYDTDRTISKVEIIDKSEEEYENGMIVPYIMKVSNGYHTGDTLAFFVDDKSVEFVIAGFYEDVMFSNPTNVSTYKLYVYDEKFTELEKELGGTKCSVSVAILRNIQKSSDFENTVIAKIKTTMEDASQVYVTANYLTLKTGTLVFVLIIMSVLVAFSGIILLISLIVIHFSTTTHIENSMKNIGAMEAAGYTPRQLILAILLEYVITATLGIIMGILLSIAVTPFITQIVSASIGLKWIASPSVMAMGISFTTIMLLTLVISYRSAAKIKKITPLIAIRSGIETHNFRKNRVALDKTKLNVHVAISAKEFVYNKRQNIVAGIIIMMLSMVCVFALSMHYNFVIDSSAMMKLVGIENAEIELKIPNDTKHIYEEVKKMPEVKKTIMIEGLDTLVRYKGKESNPHFQITKDYSVLQINTCVEGSYCSLRSQ